MLFSSAIVLLQRHASKINGMTTVNAYIKVATFCAGKLGVSVAGKSVGLGICTRRVDKAPRLPTLVSSLNHIFA